jgi:hypothetical protein
VSSNQAKSYGAFARSVYSETVIRQTPGSNQIASQCPLSSGAAPWLEAGISHWRRSMNVTGHTSSRTRHWSRSSPGVPGFSYGKRTHPSFSPYGCLSWFILLLAIFSLLLFLGGGGSSRWVIPPLIALTIVVVWRFLAKPIGTNLVGDAARYLQPRPANIAHRQAIRCAGVVLIEKLHQSGQFERIIVVGHSLGSVIAYDIIVHSWIRLHRKHRRPLSPRFRDIKEVEEKAYSLCMQPSMLINFSTKPGGSFGDIPNLG